jgi:hypothetical protein
MKLRNLVIALLLLAQLGCATQGKTIAAGMIAGAVVGAAIGGQMPYHNDHNERARNTIIGSIVFSLASGGALAWHYQEVEAETEKISGKYARMRLCDPNEMQPNVQNQLELNHLEKREIHQIIENQVGKMAISLDDNTKWAYPIFRKRFLQPETGESQMTSERYIWEIIKPGAFVTRSQNPRYFVEPEVK